MMDTNLKEIPKRRISEVEKKIIEIKIEKLRLNRERAVLILNKGVAVYFAFIIMAILGFINGLIDTLWLNILVLGGLVILIVAVLPYAKAMQREEQEMNNMLHELIKG